MKALLSIVVFFVATLLLAKLLLSSTTVGHWISGINYSEGFAHWRVRNNWVGIEREEDLWDYICLAVAALIALPISVVLYRRIR